MRRIRRPFDAFLTPVFDVIPLFVIEGALDHRRQGEDKTLRRKNPLQPGKECLEDLRTVATVEAHVGQVTELIRIAAKFLCLLEAGERFLQFLFPTVDDAEAFLSLRMLAKVILHLPQHVVRDIPFLQQKFFIDTREQGVNFWKCGGRHGKNGGWLMVDG